MWETLFQNVKKKNQKQNKNIILTFIYYLLQSWVKLQTKALELLNKLEDSRNQILKLRLNLHEMSITDFLGIWLLYTLPEQKN